MLDEWKRTAGFVVRKKVWLFGGENAGGDSIDVQRVLRDRSPRDLFDMGLFD